MSRTATAHRLLAAAPIAIALSAVGCGAATDPGSEAQSVSTNACDRYCAKLTPIECDSQTLSNAECLADCEQKREWSADCVAKSDAVLDCTTAHGTAVCQKYNGEPEVVAPAGSCDTELAALSQCIAPDAG